MKAIILISCCTLFALSAVAADAKAPTGARPADNPGEWVKTEDYPTSSLRDDEQGTVGFRLAINPDGTVETCTVTSSSGYPALDGATCSLLSQRARVVPATDKRGRPVAGTYANRVRWVLPDDEPEPAPLPGEIAFTFTVEPDGTVTDCAVFGTGKMFEYDAQLSKSCDDRPRKVLPYLDNDFKPVRKRVTLRVTTKVEDVP